MPTAALLRSFPALARRVLHGTFPRLGAFRPDEAQTGACSSARVLRYISRVERGGAAGKAMCVAHS